MGRPRVADSAHAAKLDAAACHRLDQLCAHALALQPWPRVRSPLEQWILLADPAQAARNQQAAADHRYLHVGPIHHGHDQWTSPLGYQDTVTPDGTIRTRRPRPPDGPAQCRL